MQDKKKKPAGVNIGGPAGQQLLDPRRGMINSPKQNQKKNQQ
jgi:hypothetical protein